MLFALSRLTMILLTVLLYCSVSHGGNSATEAKGKTENTYDLFRGGSFGDAGIGNFPQSIYFTHIMKCGGSTLDHLLTSVGYERNIEYTTSESIRQPAAATKMLPSALKIVIVREPISRVVSHYWQLVPHAGHKGGSNKRCTAAAKRSFSMFITLCRMYSNNFMVKYFHERIAYSLHKFNLVIPFEFYNDGLMMLHLFAGFRVRDILYISQKNVSRPSMHISDNDKALLVKYNVFDAMFYNQSVQRWNADTAKIKLEPTYAIRLQKYIKLLAEYKTYYWKEYPIDFPDWCSNQYSNLSPPEHTNAKRRLLRRRSGSGGMGSRWGQERGLDNVRKVYRSPSGTMVVDNRYNHNKYIHEQRQGYNTSTDRQSNLTNKVDAAVNIIHYDMKACRKLYDRQALDLFCNLSPACVNNNLMSR